MSNLAYEGAKAEQAVAERLRRAGFEVVRTSVQASDIGTDVVAWAASTNGELVPWAAVEIKVSRRPIPPELTLPHLARARDVLGTHDHYAVIGGRWYKADRALRSLEPVDGPSAPPYGPKGLVTDPALVEQALRQQWFQSDRDRVPKIKLNWPDKAVDVGESFAVDLTTPQGESLAVGQETIWEAGRRMLATVSERQGRYAEYSSNPAIAVAAAALLGGRISGTVLDPFCGTGSFLWAVVDRLRSEGGLRTRLIGGEINEQTAEIARSIGQASGAPVDIQTGDSFTADLPLADAIVSAPPLGVRLSEAYRLLSGDSTRESDVAAVDLAIKHLAPDGRAVLFLPRSFATRADTFRHFLARHVSVGALIATPSGSIPGTAVPGLFVVIDRRPHGRQTLVAQLGADDWQTHLTPGSALLEAVRRHLNDPGVFEK